MGEDILTEQAVQLERLLPRLIRRLFMLPPEHPVNDLPLAQLRVCVILEEGPKPISAISRELDVSVSAATQIADRLEKVGLVERLANAEDRRMRKLQLTAEGGALMQSRRLLRVRRAADALAHIAPEVRETAIHALQTLLEATIATAPELPNEDPVCARQER
jgi:DNA-binding MarR family transcriptional regulator